MSEHAIDEFHTEEHQSLDALTADNVEGLDFQHLQPCNCEVQVGRRFLRSLSRLRLLPDGQRERLLLCESSL